MSKVTRFIKRHKTFKRYLNPTMTLEENKEILKQKLVVKKKDTQESFNAN